MQWHKNRETPKYEPSENLNLYRSDPDPKLDTKYRLKKFRVPLDPHGKGSALLTFAHKQVIFGFTSDHHLGYISGWKRDTNPTILHYGLNSTIVHKKIYFHLLYITSKGNSRYYEFQRSLSNAWTWMMKLTWSSCLLDYHLCQSS